MSIMVSYGIGDHLWYFPDFFTMDQTLSPYWDYYYTCDYDEFTDTLESLLNILVGAQSLLDTARATFIVANTVDFEWDHYNDPYGSDWELDSRLFAVHVFPDEFRQRNFYYCFDSYAGLGVDSTWNGFCYYNIIDFDITQTTDYNNQNQNVACHKLTVRYGVIVIPTPPTPPQH